MGALSWGDVFFDIEANQMAAKLYGEAVARIVKDPDTAAALTPSHPFGCKRPIIDQGYYETFNRDNVTLVDLRKGPIRAVTPTGIDTEQGFHELDVIIYATGFDAMTGALTRIDIRGRDGMSLRDFWASEGPLSYLGLAVAGFPNLFIVQAPGKPFGGNEFRRRPRTARGMDRRLHRISARQRLPNHRGAARRPAGVDRAHDVAGGADRARPPDLQLLVQRRQRSRQETDVHGLHGGDSGIPSPVRRDRGRRLHGLQARLADEDVGTSVADRPGFRGRAAAGARRAEELKGWNPLSPSGVRLLGEVVLDEAALSGMTLTAPPPKLERTEEACAAAADELSALGVGAHADPEPLQVKGDSSAAVRTFGV